MKEAKSARAYTLNQLGTKVKQTFEFAFTPQSVTGSKKKWFGMDELAIMDILISRTKYLNSILPCLETRDAICFLEWSRAELEILTEQITKKGAVALTTAEKVKGHVYNIYGPPSARIQQIVFVRRSGGAITYEREWSGLQSQEVIRMLIARIKHIGKYLGRGTAQTIIWTLRMALASYEFRAKRRKEEAVNRESGDHDDQVRYRPWRYNYFLAGVIEKMKTGRDGHII